MALISLPCLSWFNLMFSGQRIEVEKCPTGAKLFLCSCKEKQAMILAVFVAILALLPIDALDHIEFGRQWLAGNLTKMFGKALMHTKFGLVLPEP